MSIFVHPPSRAKNHENESNLDEDSFIQSQKEDHLMSRHSSFNSFKGYSYHGTKNNVTNRHSFASFTISRAESPN
jgi:hypothetical protein